MNKLIFFALLVLLVTACQNTGNNRKEFSSYEQAKLVPITFDKPAIDFFDGALLGNGAMGVVVTTRPDGVMIYFGHNNVWDIRIAENHREEIKTFDYVFNKVKSIPDTLKLLAQDPWYKKYSDITRDNYSKPYPRPFPCGAVLLGFDLRKAELLGHRLDISDGLCEVYFLTHENKKITLQLFTDMVRDQLWMRLVDPEGNPSANIFDRIRVLPDPSTPAEFPGFRAEENLSGGMLSFRQILPYEVPEKYKKEKGHPKDKAFRLLARVNSTLEKTSRIDWNGNKVEMSSLESSFTGKDSFVGYVSLEEGLNTKVTSEMPPAEAPDNTAFNNRFQDNLKIWKEYWDKSGIILDDELLQKIWYHNLYFLNCAAKDGATTPGLFANWSFNNIGTAWHGDYHMNYNTQQPFWVTYSSNHLEKNLPYVNLVEFLMDVSRKWAKEYYNLPGAYFPHSAYPVDMTMNPYPVPHWGWEICETPWAVQGLWWHYLYSMDKEFLQKRAYIPIKEAVEFLVAYMKRPEARGPQWGDDKYHIFPTIPPELYALRPGFKYNYDCTVDLTLIKFVFNAFQESVKVLGTENEEAELLAGVSEILNNYPEYPKARSEKYGEILVSVPGEHDQVVYNLPNPLITVFPGEDHGLHSDSATMAMVKNTFLNQQNEGGNDLVFRNLQAARIGMLDIEKFKRQVNYSLMPNGTASDRVMQVHGRYNDRTNYGFMDKMGVWFENFALPVVINECLMQSYNGTIRFFPNWPMDKDAEFHNLRAAGAFLVSAELKDGKVREIRILSEAGSDLKLILPWGKNGSVKNNQGRTRVDTDLISLKTEKGETIIIEP